MLDDFGVFPAVVEAELRRYLPFLATTKVLIAAVRRGVGRETAHEVIKEHAVAVALSMRDTGRSTNDLLDRLAADPRLGVGSPIWRMPWRNRWNWRAWPDSRWPPWLRRWTRSLPSIPRRRPTDQGR